jgi:hypothetical protein
MSLVRIVAPVFFTALATSTALIGCADPEQDVLVEPETSLAPQSALSLRPAPAFTISAAGARFSAPVDSLEYQLITVTTARRPVVINSPAKLTGDVGPRTDGGMIFWDTQTGSCWQQYEAHGNPIPAFTTCTIQVGFHPDAVRSYNAALSVTQCTSWSTDPTWGFIVCNGLGLSETVSLSGQGT